MYFWEHDILDQIHPGAIIKMDPASRSHAKSFYYVEILTVGEDKIVTNIPGEHSLEITKDNNWDYHLPRMKYIGDKEQYGYLLLNQKFI